MNDDAQPVSPDPWRDPEFSPDRSGRGKIGNPVGPGRDPGPRRRTGVIRGPAWILALLLAAVSLDLLLDPMFGPMMMALVANIGLALGVMAGAMVLGTTGFALFAAGERVIAWLRRGTQWPEN
jgi:hypothetical protein